MHRYENASRDRQRVRLNELSPLSTNSVDAPRQVANVQKAHGCCEEIRMKGLCLDRLCASALNRSCQHFVPEQITLRG
jgi:hypothetical protein